MQNQGPRPPEHLCGLLPSPWALWPATSRIRPPHLVAFADACFTRRRSRDTEPAKDPAHARCGCGNKAGLHGPGIPLAAENASHSFLAPLGAGRDYSSSPACYLCALSAPILNPTGRWNLGQLWSPALATRITSSPGYPTLRGWGNCHLFRSHS